jgi:hypothetical protein
VPALIAQQLSGMSAYVLRGAVARGEVRIQPTHAMTRYLYHRDDCERLRMQGTAASHAVTARGAA